MATLRDDFTAALMELGVLAEGEVPTAAQAADALRAVNRMLGQWQAESLVFYINQRTTFPIVPGTHWRDVMPMVVPKEREPLPDEKRAAGRKRSVTTA